MMSISVSSEALHRFADADMSNLTLIDVPTTTTTSCKTPTAILIGAIVLLGLALMILVGWSVLLWIRRVEKRDEKRCEDDLDEDEYVAKKGQDVKDV
jgi:hypothetical protein